MEGEGKGRNQKSEGIHQIIMYPINKISLTKKLSFLSITENLESSDLLKKTTTTTKDIHKKTLKKNRILSRHVTWFRKFSTLLPNNENCYLEKPLQE